MLKNSGFEQIQVVPGDENRSFMENLSPDNKISGYVASASIEAVKPVK